MVIALTQTAEDLPANTLHAGNIDVVDSDAVAAICPCTELVTSVLEDQKFTDLLLVFLEEGFLLVEGQ